MCWRAELGINVTIFTERKGERGMIMKFRINWLSLGVNYLDLMK
jgi:hypothetical protein